MSLFFLFFFFSFFFCVCLSRLVCFVLFALIAVAVRIQGVFVGIVDRQQMEHRARALFACEDLSNSTWAIRVIAGTNFRCAHYVVLPRSVDPLLYLFVGSFAIIDAIINKPLVEALVTASGMFWDDTENSFPFWLVVVGVFVCCCCFC